MAKIRRVIRKLKTPTTQGLDEQAWPVFMALVILGGFVTGSILAYLRFDDPRWYANAVLWLLVALGALAVGAVLLAVINNRQMRRSMQLALLLGLLFHAVLFVSSIELRIFDRIFDVFASRQESKEPPQPVIVPEYFQTAQREHERPDFQRPVETETPEPEPEPIEREQTEPEERPSEPQPTPVPEPEQTVRPNLVRREQPEETAPRQNEDQSQLSRRMAQSRPTPPSTSAETAQSAPEQASRSSLRAQDSEVARRAAESQMQRREVDQDPSTESPQSTAQMARRENRESPDVQPTATPAMRSELNRPINVPRIEVPVASSPTVSRRTRPDEIQPNTTLTQKQNTASPDRPETVAEPVPEASQSVAETPQRRELPSVERVNIARTPTATPNRQARITPRPEVNTAASEVTPTNTPQPPSRQPTLVESPTTPRRQTTSPSSRELSAAVSEPAPAAPRPAAAATRRQSQAAPAAASNAVEPAAPRRQAAGPALAANTQADAAAPAAMAAATSGTAGAVAASTSTNRQSTSGPTARSVTALAPASAASSAAAPPSPDVARRQTAASPSALAASAPASTPRRSTQTPSAATNRAAEATAAASSPQADARQQIAAASTQAARRATGGAQTGPAESISAPAAPSGPTRLDAVASAAARMPRAPQAPTVAQGTTSSPTRRESTAAVPSAATATADVVSNVAPVRASDDQPSPSAATVARQTSRNTTAERSQRAMEQPAASTATQVARATGPRSDSVAAPSISSSNRSGTRPERSSLKSAIAASPTNVESPAMEQSTRGLGDPTAVAARTALAKSSSGTAGIGSGRNLDRARPAADSPAMVASASARRAESTQLAEAGPAMSPSAPATVRRARAGSDAPGAALQAEPVAQVATAAGTEQPSELSANASAALTRNDANSRRGPVTAAAGTAEVDLGPTRVVSEGETGRASGGGQPAINFQTDASQLARSDLVGGTPMASIAADTVVDAPTAPAGDSSDQPMTPETEAQPTSVARTDAGGGEPISGGPSHAAETGPPTEVAMAERVAESAMSRAEAAEAVMGTAVSGGGKDDEEDEEERRRRLARAAAQLALATATTADPIAAAGQGEMGGGQQAASAAATSLARASTGDTAGEATGGTDDVQPADAAGGAVALANDGRAEVPEGTPVGPSITALADSAVGRSARGIAGPATAAQAEVATGATSTEQGPPAMDATAGDTRIARADAAVGSGTASSPTVASPDATGDQAGTELAATGIARAETGRIGNDQPATGDGSSSGEAIASLTGQIGRRASNGAPQLAASGPTAADLPEVTAETGTATDGIVDGNAVAVETQMERSTQGGQPTAGELASIVEAGPSGGAGGGELGSNQFVRAEAVEGAPGRPAMGGGTGSPARSARGATLASNTQADAVAMTGAPNSGGINNGTPIAAQGLEAARLAGGVPSPTSVGPVGAARADDVVDVALAGQPGTAMGLRGAASSADDGPEATSPSNLGAPLPKSSTTRLPNGPATLARIEVPGAGSLDPDPNALPTDMGDAAGELAMARQAIEGGLAVEMDAIDGPGGLGAEFTADVGLNSRRAMADSMRVQMRSARFIRHDVGGLPDFSTSAVVAAEPFRRRMSRGDGDGPGGGAGSPPPMTEESVELGLAFLARHQLQDGSWSLQGINNEPAALVSDTAATGLAMLAFQGAGYTHLEHRYANVVNAGLQYLLDHQQENGDLFIPLDDDSNRSVWLYSHSIAAIVLCEAYGMTQAPDLRDAAQRAIDFIVNGQNPERGGWRYSPQKGSDTSVTGWMMMALKSGELAGLDVPQRTYKGIQGWLDLSQQRGEPHLYRYNPMAPDTPTQRHGREPSKTMTAVGLLMRLYSGWRRDNPNMANGAEYLSQHLPSLGSQRNPERDTYYWYYATQVMFHMGGEHWEQWNGQLHPLLIGTQVRQGSMAGSWNPRTPVPDRWAPHAGRLYVTAMNLLSLEVYYRHLPLYEDTAR